jgi:hypothetical protein
MLPGATPAARSCFFEPSSRGSMIELFHRACTMPTRNELPSCCWLEGPLTVDILIGGSLRIEVVERPSKMPRVATVEHDNPPPQGSCQRVLEKPQCGAWRFDFQAIRFPHQERQSLLPPSTISTPISSDPEVFPTLEGSKVPNMLPIDALSLVTC